MPDPVSDIRRAIHEAATERAGESLSAAPTLERPPKAELGDYSTNAAMLLAPIVGASPRAIAEELSEEVGSSLGGNLERVEVAGPGFLNLFMAPEWYHQTLAAAQAGLRPGAAPGERDRILLEFVSANPTGPLTAAGARHAAFGDSLGRVLELAGHEVTRTYYVNDAGGQIQRFAQSIAARMTGEDLPEDGYAGEYVADLAQSLSQEGVDPGDLDAVGQAGVERMRERIKSSLATFRVDFDEWVSERALHETGQVEAAIGVLEEAGHVYTSEGAKWLRTSEFGDDKDRVLVREGGEPTYFAADIAHHRLKLESGSDRLITVLGADHHGYVPRLKAAIEALGRDPETYEAPIMQLVHLIEGGERAAMSKRKGDFATLDELVADIGVDAARFFMLQRSHDTTIDLDLDLAREETSENPVYYVQYAHARICRLLEKAGPEAGGQLSAAAGGGAFEPSERALVKRIADFPAEVEGAALRRAPHRIAAYATALAADFHAFYRDCPVVDAPEPVRSTRVALAQATRRTIAQSLELLGVSAPERM